MDSKLLLFFLIQLEKLKTKLSPTPQTPGYKKPSLSDMDNGRQG